MQPVGGMLFSIEKTDTCPLFSILYQMQQPTYQGQVHFYVELINIVHKGLNEDETMAVSWSLNRLVNYVTIYMYYFPIY